MIDISNNKGRFFIIMSQTLFEIEVAVNNKRELYMEKVLRKLMPYKVERIEDLTLQNKGADFMVDNAYYLDMKSTNKVRETVALEVASNATNDGMRKRGWFTDGNKYTNVYMFIEEGDEPDEPLHGFMVNANELKQAVAEYITTQQLMITDVLLRSTKTREKRVTPEIKVVHSAQLSDLNTNLVIDKTFIKRLKSYKDLTGMIGTTEQYWIAVL